MQRRILSSDADTAIRAELFSIERLEAHAQSLAIGQPVSGTAPYREPLPKRLKQNAAALTAAFEFIARSAQQKKAVTPAGEWLLDNFHVVEEQVREIKRHLPPNYYRQLPKLSEGPLAGYPRIYGITWTITAHTDSAVTLDHLIRFVNSYQQVAPLTIGELWAMGVTLRITLVENLRRLAEASIWRSKEHERADAFADGILAPQESRDSQAIVKRLQAASLSASFVVRLEKRLRDSAEISGDILGWLDKQLQAVGTTMEQLVSVEYDRQSAANVSVRNIISTMRLISTTDWADFVESVSLVDRLLNENGTFRALDFATRNRYRNVIERLARRSHMSEIQVTEAVMQNVHDAVQTGRPRSEQDAGYYLISDGVSRVEQSISYRFGFWDGLWRATAGISLPLYIGTIAMLSLFLLFAVVGAIDGEGSGLIAPLILGLLPASEIAIAVTNRILTRRLGPACLPGLKLADGVPPELRSVVAVPILLTDTAAIDEQVKQLEVHYFANPEDNLTFILLSDWLDSDTESEPCDAALLTHAQEGIARLNREHPSRQVTPRFLLLHRRRVWNESHKQWMGWERKRGKLHELNRLLRGASDTTFMDGEAALSLVPRDAKYVITLDADTRLPRGAAKKLIGKIAHPLNRAELDGALNCVVQGYGILQPRVTPSLPAHSEGSLFQWTFSRATGLDPYAFAVSDVYQDLFLQGSYVGKGIYDIDVFEAVLSPRIPENAVLSHDLLEGIYARAALVSDVEVVEDFPSRYDVEAARQHRWVRGDWQLLPWIFSRRSHISALGRWKMLDNLRRSLISPASLLAFLWGWTLPLESALWWTGFIFASIALPPVMPVLSAFSPFRIKGLVRSGLRPVAHEAVLALLQIVFVTAFLARHAYLALDAIGRTLFRLFISRRYMLQWVTFAQTAYSRHGDLLSLAFQMAGALAFAGAVIAIILQTSAERLEAAAPFLALWAFSPMLARWASRTPDQGRIRELSDRDRQGLRLVARRTWRFFERFVTPDVNMLPPDNFQETPRPVVAQRTSPTNIGVYLLAVISARDFGWTGTADMLDRLEAALESMRKLQQFRGHLLNWYDVATLQPLYPRYVSSVDSGNLAAHLIAVKNACLDQLDEPIERWAWREGLRDTLVLLREACTDRGPTGPSRERLFQEMDALSLILRRPVHSAAELTAAFDHLRQHADAIADYAQEFAREHETGEFAVWAKSLQRTVQSFQRDFDDLLKETGPAEPIAGFSIRTSPHGAMIAAKLRKIAEVSEDFVLKMDFRFLYNGENKLLYIGYRVDDQEPDSNCYDLLASEARLASLVAIAKGDVPTLHWFHLGRTMVAVGRGAALQSWSGSMFEYLMPSLVLHEPSGSLLAQTDRLAVARQIAYGRRHGVPWGISESQYNGRDLEQNYQYTGFGVPDLGLKRGLAENLVVAPYATGLAAMIEPAAALRNFERIAALGGRGPYGWYEAIDYTRSRLKANQTFAIIRSYMAHHQAMSILGISVAIHGAPFRRRFHSEAMIQATELLLQERIASDVYLARPPRELMIEAAKGLEQTAPAPNWRIATPHTSIPKTHLLSNGRYSVMLTGAGSGYSRWHDRMITRWYEDVTRDHWGSYIFLRDVRSNLLWSAGYQPVCVEPDDYEALFAEDYVCITRNDYGLTTKLEILVSPEDDAEVRRVSITNNGNRTRQIELTSYAELVLASAREDASHPAFAKMFVQTEFVRDLGAVIARRKPREAGGEDIWAAHMAVVEGDDRVGDLQFETDRHRFLGRNQSLRLPGVLAESWPLSNTTGAVLDPIFSIRRSIVIPRGHTAHVSFWTLAADTREEIVALADKHRDKAAFARAATLAETKARSQLQHLSMASQDAYLFQALANHLIYANGLLRPSSDALCKGLKSQSNLWPLSVSGDLPILLLQIDDVTNVEIVRQLLKAHEYWRSKNFAADIVVLNECAASYTQNLQTTLDMLVRAGGERAIHSDGKGGRIFLVRSDLANPDLKEFLMAAARVVLSGAAGTLFDQLKALQEQPAAHRTSPAVRKRPPSVASVSASLPSLEYFNGLGGFADEGREYVTILGPGKNTPAPWINVIANREFGFQASAEGAGFTWAVNSQQNKITAWSNDPIGNEASEAIYIRDLESGEVWCPTACPVRDANGTYMARHGQGYSTFEYASRGIVAELVQFVPLDGNVKISRLKLRNTSRRARRLAVYAYVGWTLGEWRAVSAPYIVTRRDDKTGALLARNPWHNDFGHRVAFFDMGGRQKSWTCDRTEFLGRHGSLEHPAAPFSDTPLSGRAGAGADPCCAVQTEVTLAANEVRQLSVFLGQEQDQDSAIAAVEKSRELHIDLELKRVKQFWEDMLNRVEVHTPDRSMDLMLNRWLLYQTLSCRIWARAGFYQVSGAYGFRDQLQDVMALCVAKPEIARQQIVRAAGRQFVEGDVQHWWLNESGKGIRTRISDDRAWLAYVVLHYLEVTKDKAILDTSIPFLEGPVLSQGQKDWFYQPTQSARSATLYEHCALALDASLSVGAHGLPLMGSGDWNDGMNRVGENGKGESIWLGWFLFDALSRFAGIAEERHDARRAANWIVHAAALKDAIETHGWDGDWYLRAYFDDGSPLGSASNRECRIDSIAQSWSVISGGAPPERAERAMEAVERYLVRANDNLITLFSPPFTTTPRDPGYIKAYPAGIRENGGQYTHAAAWTVIAFAMLGNGDKACELYAMLNPINQAKTLAAAQRYRVEPYVTTGDVYSVAPHLGRGGWTWYSGSAGWMYRAGLEWILGLRVQGDTLRVSPCIPSHWPGFDATIRHGDAVYWITVENPERTGKGVSKICVDGKVLAKADQPIPLKRDSKEHHVRVVLGTVRAAALQEATHEHG